MQTQDIDVASPHIERAQQTLTQIGNVITALRTKRAEAEQLDVEIQSATAHLGEVETAAAMDSTVNPKTARSALRALREKKEHADLAVAGLTAQHQMFQTALRDLAPSVKLLLKDRGTARLNAIQASIEPAIEAIRRGFSEARGVAIACNISSPYFSINGSEIISLSDRSKVLSSRQLLNDLVNQERATFDGLNGLLRDIQAASGEAC